MKTREFAIVSIRLFALFLAIISVMNLIVSLIENASEFNPSYLYWFFQVVILKPVLGLLTAILVFFCSRRTGNFLSKNLS